MPRKAKYRRPYPPELWREAVALYARTDRTLGEIVGDLGVSRESLRLWVQQAQIERGEREGLSGDEGEELRELRRRVLLLDRDFVANQDLVDIPVWRLRARVSRQRLAPRL